MRLELTKSAIEDVCAIGDYTYETWGEVQEVAYLEGMYKKFEEVLEYPARWRFRHDLFPQCQIAKYGRHVILFLSHDEVLTIVRVLHDAMDFEQHLNEEY